MKQKNIKLINRTRTDGSMRGRGLAELVLMLTLSFFSLSSTFALTYSSDVDLSFTFNPSVTVAISGDLVIDNLSPGNTADSNEITVTAGTNYEDGLILTGTVGNNTDTNPSHNNTNLTHANGTNAFVSLLPTDSYSSLNDNAITTNTWGYATKPTAGNNQIWSSYSGLPIYNDAGGGTVLLTATTLGTNTLLFKIGAKSLATQVAGTYTNTINFTATTRIVTTNYTISYNDATSEATNLPASQTGTITTTTYVNLSQTVPERASYSFVGWCSVNNSSDPSTCTGTTYQPGDPITISNPGGSLTVPLYAVWEEAGETWYFNEDITNSSIAIITGGNKTLMLNFTSDGESYGLFFFRYSRYDSGDSDFIYDLLYCPDDFGGILDNCATAYGLHPYHGWYEQPYRTITITGGADADNPVFRSWLSANATQL